MKTAAPEKKSVKTLKGQLFGAVSMMLVAAIALGTSTYAWFIGNQTVEVQNMNLTVSTSTALLAAVGKPASITTDNERKYAAAEYTTFKTVIINDDIIGAGADQGGWVSFLKTPMKPASVCDTELLKTSAFPAFFQSTDKLTSGRISDFTPLGIDMTPVTDITGVGQGPVKHVRFAFQASEDLNVYFGRAEDTANSIDALVTIDQLITPKTAALPADQATLDAQAEAIKAALRVAIVPERSRAADGTPNSEPLKPIVFQFNDDKLVAAFNNQDANNTFYKTDVTDTDTLLLAEAGGVGYRLPNTATVGSDKGKYPAVAALVGGATADKDKISAVSTQTTVLAANGANYIATIDMTTGSPVVVTKVGGQEKTPLFALKANTARVVDVYIWLEGTDEQCVNYLSNFTFNLSLPFAAGKTGTVAPTP